MTQDLAASIDSFLRTEPGRDGWFREIEIVERFGLPDDRILRADGSLPGPLSRSTIFSGRGVKHLDRATPDEIRKCQERVRKSILSAVYRRRWLREGIARVMDGNVERITGQGRMET